MTPDYRVFETRPITNSNEWQDYVLRLRLTWPASPNKQEEIDRNLRLVAILSDIPNRDLRHRCLQGFVYSVLAPKKAGQKSANRDETFARRDLKISLAVEKLRVKQGYTKEEAMQEILNARQKYDFGPDDRLPATVKGIAEAEQRSRTLWGHKRKLIPRRKKKHS